MRQVREATWMQLRMTIFRLLFDALLKRFLNRLNLQSFAYLSGSTQLNWNRYNHLTRIASRVEGVENFVNDVFNEYELDARIQGLHEQEKPIARSEDEEDNARIDLD